MNIKDGNNRAVMVSQMYMNDKQLLLEVLKGNPILITRTQPKLIPVVRYHQKVKVDKIKHSTYKFENACIKSTKKFRSKYGQI